MLWLRAKRQPLKKKRLEDHVRHRDVITRAIMDAASAKNACMVPERLSKDDIDKRGLARRRIVVSLDGGSWSRSTEDHL